MTTSLPPVLSGQCACGATHWHSTSPATHLDFCYCTTCQRVTGAPFGAWLGIARDSLVWTGPIATYTVSNLATRSMCRNCGASLSIQYRCYANKTHVAAGTVVEGADTLPRLTVHIFVSEKPVWYEIPDGDEVERWDGFDEEFARRQRKFDGEQEEKKKKRRSESAG